MRRLHLLLALLPLAFLQPAEAQKLSKEERRAQSERQLEEVRALIEGRRFEIEITHVFPMGGGDVSRFNPRGKVTVKDSIAEGYLPFFGRAYTLPYGEGGGIEFDAVMKDEKVKVVEKRRKRTVRYTFQVQGKNDTYNISIEAAGKEGCNIHLTSNNRTQISYSGRISEIGKE